jgi:hypothetical protein
VDGERAVHRRLLSSKETLIDGMKQIEDLLFLVRAHQVDRPSVA